MSRFPPGLPTTLAVQKCGPSLPFELVNRAPTAAAPWDGLLRQAASWPDASVADDTTYAPIAVAIRVASQAVRCMAKTTARRTAAAGRLTPRRIQSSPYAGHPRRRALGESSPSL